VTSRETFFIFNGQERNIMEFSEESESARIIGELSFQNGTSVFSTTAVPDRSGDAWLFAGNNPKATNPVLFFNSTEKIAYIPTTNTTRPPALYSVPATFYDRDQSYLIGGLGRVPEGDGSFHPANGILT
jgi:hypothetical protein